MAAREREQLADPGRLQALGDQPPAVGLCLLGGGFRRHAGRWYCRFVTHGSHTVYSGLRARARVIAQQREREDVAMTEPHATTVEQPPLTASPLGALTDLD